MPLPLWFRKLPIVKTKHRGFTSLTFMQLVPAMTEWSAIFAFGVLSPSFLIKIVSLRSQKSKIVYKASCWDCDAFYIGKTKRRLHDRKTEHFKALTQIGPASAVAEHSISTGHSIKWDHFEILASGPCDLHCKIKEAVA